MASWSWRKVSMPRSVARQPQAMDFPEIVGHGSVSVISTKAAQNGTDGFQVTNGSMTVESSLAAGNGVRGLHVVAGGIARIANSTLTDNGTGIRNSGTVETRQNNTVRGNGIDLQGNALTAIGGT